NNNNPCRDSFNSSVVGLWCISASPAGSIMIPAASLVNCNGSQGTFSGTQIPGRVFIWGPPGTTLYSFTYTSQNTPNGTGQCKTAVELGFHSGPGGSTVVIAWGGHIATTSNWGMGNSASSISGSPYHMALNSLDGATSGSQDRALASSAIYFTP